MSDFDIWAVPSAPQVPTFDPEIVCATNDGWETIIKAVALFDTTNGVPTLQDFSGATLTGYTVVPCVDSSQIVEWDIWCDGGVNVIPFYETETNGLPSATIAFWFNPLTNSVVTPSGTQTPWACSVSNINVIEKNLVQVWPQGEPTGAVVKEVRKYDDLGNLLSTEYFDSVTGSPVTINAPTAQLAEANGLDKEPITMCDNGVTFLRHIVYTYGPWTVFAFDTLIDWVTPYTTSWSETVWACAINNSSKVVWGSLGVVAWSDLTSVIGPFNDGSTVSPNSIDTSSIPLLQSLTVKAIDVVNGWFDWATTSQVVVSCPDGTVHIMMNGETQTWSIVNDNDSELAQIYKISATGSAYANISYTTK